MSTVRTGVRVVVIDHPYAKMLLTKLRNKNTGIREFRESMRLLGRIIGLELTRELKVRSVKVETPLGVAEGIEMPELENNIVLVSVLRAAIPLTEGLMEVFPKARLGLISARRVEERGMKPGYLFDVEVSYVKVPEVRSDDVVVISDPMLATGSTLVAVMNKILERGRARKYLIASVISTMIGITRVLSTFSDLDLKIYTVAIDEKLNDKGFIVPGLGDAGDRAFGT